MVLDDKSSFVSLITGLMADVRSRYGWKMAVLVLLMTMVALSEGLGMVLLLPLLAAIGVSSAAEGGLLAHWLNSGLAYFGIEHSAYLIAIALLVVFAVQLTCFVMQSWWISWIQRDYGAYWQNRIFNSLVYAEWGFFTEQKLGNLSNLIAHETFRLSGALMILLQMAALTVTALVYLVVAVAVSWQVTTLMVLLAVFLFTAVKGIGRKNFQIGTRLGPLTSRLTVLVTEFFGGIKLIKATATENIAAARVKEVVDELRVQHTWATFLPSLVRAIFEFSSIVALCFILVFGYQHLEIAAASMLVVLALFVRLLPRFNALQQNMQLLANFIPAFSAVDRIVRAAESCSERGRYLLTASFADSSVTEGGLLVSIRRAGYSESAILKDIEVRFPERGVVGIVGESGAGKTTLANCLLGLVKVADGDVLLGNMSIKDVPLNIWRRQIGYVPQETVLFHSSIRDNIAWGMPSATDDEIVDAAKQALAHEFILQQPSGYLTVVGDRGARLSGGQCQRLGIARALLMKPKLLVMDEATSALDSTSEAAVLETIERLRGEICIVMVAHRLATIRKADMVVVMESGSVAEIGTWRELIAKNGRFHKLATAQHIVQEAV